MKTHWRTSLLVFLNWSYSIQLSACLLLSLCSLLSSPGDKGEKTKKRVVFSVRRAENRESPRAGEKESRGGLQIAEWQDRPVFRKVTTIKTHKVHSAKEKEKWLAAKLVGFSVARLHRKTEVKSPRTCGGFMCLINMTFISTHRCQKLSVLVCVCKFECETQRDRHFISFI